MNIVNRGFHMPEFAEYVKTLTWKNWRPVGICIHHCAAPSLAQRPAGFISQHMLNLQDFYEGKGWSAGPHLFTDDDQAWVFSPLTARGVHAGSFNAGYIGIEMLGDYDSEDPWTGRGLEVLKTTCAVVRTLAPAIGLKLSDAPKWIRFHRDDPKTSKTCPGKKITKERFLSCLASS